MIRPHPPIRTGPRVQPHNRASPLVVSAQANLPNVPHEAPASVGNLMLASRGLVQILPKSSLDRRNTPTPRRLRKPTSGAGRFVRHRSSHRCLAMKYGPATSHLERSRDERRKNAPLSCLLTTARLRFSPKVFHPPEYERSSPRVSSEGCRLCRTAP